jgi:four helix bundle protein
VRDFQELDVWHASHDLTLAIYAGTVRFPYHERYGLVSQLRRATVSIETNIAEGAGKKTDVDFAHFLQIAFGSANEVGCELLIARDVHYLSDTEYKELVEKLSSVKKMLARFIQYLERKTQNSPRNARQPTADGRQQ